MQSTFFLDIVIRKSTAVLQLFSGENETLLVWGNSLFVLDFSLDIFDSVGGFDFQSDGFTRESLHKNLHTTTESEDQVEGGLLLDVVVGEGSAILELLTGEDKSLLVWGNTLFVLNKNIRFLK